MSNASGEDRFSYLDQRPDEYCSNTNNRHRATAKNQRCRQTTAKTATTNRNIATHDDDDDGDDSNVLKIISYRTKRTHDGSSNYLLFKVEMIDGKNYENIETDNLVEDCPLLFAKYVLKNYTISKNNPKLREWASRFMVEKGRNREKVDHNQKNPTPETETTTASHSSSSVSASSSSSSTATSRKRQSQKPPPLNTDKQEQQQQSDNQKHRNQSNKIRSDRSSPSKIQQTNEKRTQRSAAATNTRTELFSVTDANADAEVDSTVISYDRATDLSSDMSQYSTSSPSQPSCSYPPMHQHQNSVVIKQEDEEEKQRQQQLNESIESQLEVQRRRHQQQQIERKDRQHEPTASTLMEIEVAPIAAAARLTPNVAGADYTSPSSLSLSLSISPSSMKDSTIDEAKLNISILLGIVDEFVRRCNHYHREFFQEQQQQEITLNDLQCRNTVAVNSGDVVVDALNRLKHMLSSSSSSDITTLLEQFYCIGGIARVLELVSILSCILKKINSVSQKNENDFDGDAISNTLQIMDSCAEFTSFLLSFCWSPSIRNKKLATEIAEMIVRRNGIYLLLSCITVTTSMMITFKSSLMSIARTELKHCWTIIGRTINISNAEGPELDRNNGDAVTVTNDDFVDKPSKLSVLSVALDFISKQPGGGRAQQQQRQQPIDDIAIELLSSVLYAVANLLKAIDKEDLKGTRIVSVLLNKSSLLKDDRMMKNDVIIASSLGVLTVLSKKQVFGRRKKDLETLLPLLVHCTLHFNRTSPQIISFVLILLELACEKLSKQNLEDAGILAVVSGSLLRPDSLINEETKEKARSILRKILS